MNEVELPYTRALLSSSWMLYLDVRHGSLTTTFQSLPSVKDWIEIMLLLNVRSGPER